MEKNAESCERENRRRMVEIHARKKAVKKRAEYAQRLDRFWLESFRACFPPDFKITGPKNIPEYPSTDSPVKFPGGAYLELEWQGRQEKNAGLGAVCPYCGARSERSHEYMHRTLYDLPLRQFGKTELWISYPRYDCLALKCRRSFAPEFMDSFDVGSRDMTRRLQEFVFLLADRVSAEMTRRILSETEMDNCGKNVCSGDTVLRIKKEYEEDAELRKYTVPGTCKIGRAALSACAEKLEQGLFDAGEDLMTVQEQSADTKGREVRLRPRSIRLAAMKRVLDLALPVYPA